MDQIRFNVETDPDDKVQEQTIELSLLTLAGHCYTVKATPSWTVRGVKDAITSQTRIASHQQRPLFGARVRRDAEILAALLPSEVFGLRAVFQMHHELLLVICVDEEKADAITSLVLGRTHLKNVDAKYHEDHEVVHAAVRFDGMQLEYAHGAARKDRSIVLSAIAQNGFALMFAPTGFNTEREVVLMAVKSSSLAFSLAEESLQTDVEFAIKAVSANSFVRDYVDKSVLADARFVQGVATYTWSTKSTCFRKPSQEPAFEDNGVKTTIPDKVKKSFCPFTCPRLAWCRMPTSKWTTMS